MSTSESFGRPHFQEALVADLPLPGHPYRSVVAGPQVFVSLRVGTESEVSYSGIAVIHQQATSLELSHVLPCATPRGMATDRDDHLLVARDEGAVSFFDLNSMIAGAPNPEVGVVPTVENGSTGMVTLSVDGSLALTSEERAARVGLIDLAEVRDGHFESVFRNSIETDLFPISVVQAAAYNSWFVSCQTTGRDEDRVLKPGTVMAFDADKLISDPQSALCARLANGNPVRLALSHQGAYLWVTSRA